MRKFVMLAMLLLGLVICANVSLANHTPRAVIDGKTADRVHLRAGASADSKSLGLYFTGTEAVYVATTVDEWVWVNIGSETGYIKSEFLHFENDPGSVISQQPAGTVKNENSSWVNLRPDPNDKYAAIGKCYNGDVVTILGETITHWYYVKAGDQYGYILSDLVTMGSSALPDTPGASGGGADARSALQSVLKNNAAFISAPDKRTLKLSQLPGSFANAIMEITRFAVVDLDQDGIPEVILWEKVNGNDYGVEVLHYQNGVVYGYEFGHRQVGQLKTDGTFSFSSSASDSGIGMLIFTNSAYAMDKITYSRSSDTNNNFFIEYFVNKMPATESEFTAAVNSQGQKPDAIWYTLTTENINLML